MELGNEFSLFFVFSLFWVRFGGFVGVVVVVRIFSGGRSEEHTSELQSPC